MKKERDGGPREFDGSDCKLRSPWNSNRNLKVPVVPKIAIVSTNEHFLPSKGSTTKNGLSKENSLPVGGEISNNLLPEKLSMTMDNFEEASKDLSSVIVLEPRTFGRHLSASGPLNPYDSNLDSNHINSSEPKSGQI